MAWIERGEPDGGGREGGGFGEMTAAAQVSILVAMGAGVLSFLSPCVFPLIPSYLAFVGGLSVDEIQGTVADSRNRRHLLLRAVTFIAGFSVIFIAFGASATALGQLLFDYQLTIRKVGGALIILFGLHIAGWLPLPFLMRERHLELTGHPGGYVGAFLVGVTFAAGWIPCVGPILGSILVMASTSQDASQGILLLTAYAAGLAIPFLLSALLFGQFLAFFTRFKRLLPWVSRTSGVFLILVGVLLLSDYFTLLSTFALRFTPAWLFQRL
ncbi:MAG: cytochrome c biogenesis CcdA family protein [Candidatus Methylomirabilales bacterium]